MKQKIFFSNLICAIRFYRICIGTTDNITHGTDTQVLTILLFISRKIICITFHPDGYQNVSLGYDNIVMILTARKKNHTYLLFIRN